MLPDAAHPERGSFVRDQVAALRALDGLDVTLHEFAPGAPALARAALDLRRLRAGGDSRAAGDGPHRAGGDAVWDVVHAHFGLSAWPALAARARVRALTVHGTDLRHPRTRLATRAVLARMDIVAAVSDPLARELPARAAARAQVLPCGVDVQRFGPLARAQARAELALDPLSPYLLFAADPSRPEKRHDLALALSRALDVRLLTLGGVEPARVPLWVNAANAVLVPSEREGFGLAVLEALACDVPVLATPVGIHPVALRDVPGTLCAPFDLERWRAAVAPHVQDRDPRVRGRASALRFSTSSMAERVAQTWRAALDRRQRAPG